MYFEFFFVFLFFMFSGWQLGRDHHGRHGHIRAQPLSGGHRSHHQGPGGQRGARLPSLLYPDPGRDHRPAGVPDAAGLPGAPPPPLAGEAAELRHSLRGPLHLRGLQAAHTAAGRVGALFQAATGRPTAGLRIPGAARRSGAAFCRFLLAVLRSQNTRLTGAQREGYAINKRPEI